MSDTAALDTNLGGRVRFEVGSEVRYLELDGRVSRLHLVQQERADRKGYVSLIQKDGTNVVRVRHSRILPASVDGKAVVIQVQDRACVLCPGDGHVQEVSASDAEFTCQQCGSTFTLFWLGGKPMADATKTREKAPKTEKAEKTAPAKAAKEPRPAKAVKEPTPIDFDAMAGLKHCELWTKGNVTFDHERIDVAAHILIYVPAAGHGEPRKLCFNSYNGTLGKKAEELPIEAFVKNEPIKGAKKPTPWFTVNDLEKARAKMTKEGYKQHTVK